MKKEMKKKTGLGIAMVLAILMLGSVAEAFSGTGSGTQEDPYIITDVNELQEMNDDLDAWYTLGNDIDASETSGWNAGAGFFPIGNDVNAFTGHFDGKGYAISGLCINRPSASYVGLFGYTLEGSEIKNVNCIDFEVTGINCVGSLIGYGTCNITNCSSRGSIEGEYFVGGLVGFIPGELGTTVDNCYFTGIVSGYQFVGGIVGDCASPSTVIKNSYSTGTVNGNEIVGGLVGSTLFAHIENCYSSGSVVGDSNVGGFCGYNYGSSCDNCFWDTQTSGQTTSAGGIGKTTAEMKQQATFTNWDFINIWDIIEDETYPFHSRIFPVRQRSLLKRL